MNYIVYLDGAEQGPYSSQDLEMMESTNDLIDETPVRLEQHDIWKTWSQIKEENAQAVARKEAYAEMRSPKIYHHPTARVPYAFPTDLHEAHSRGTYIILGLFFGTLGFHNFYAGYTYKAIVQLAITVLLAFVFIGPLITAIWALIEIITVREDAEGTPFVP